MDANGTCLVLPFCVIDWVTFYRYPITRNSGLMVSGLPPKKVSFTDLYWLTEIHPLYIDVHLVYSVSSTCHMVRPNWHPETLSWWFIDTPDFYLVLPTIHLSPRVGVLPRT